MAVTKAKFYVTEKLGPKQSLTPEGFLLCEEVPIARTGMLLYGPDEVPIDDKDGFVKIFREEDEVFHPEAIASFMGKPVTNDHPATDVTPENWNELAVGTCMNPRRGLGAMDDLLIADLLITNADAIQEVQDGKREVSCGYEADYEETAPGAGRQTDIRGNHIALVESGRCGARCAISDHSTINKEAIMAKKTNWLDRLKAAIKSKDEAGVEELMKDAPPEIKDEVPADEGGDTHIHIHQGEPAPAAKVKDDDPMTAYAAKNDQEHKEFRDRLDALEAGMKPAEDDNKEIEGSLKEEAPEGTGDEELKATKDSRYLKDSFKTAMSYAEILVPGIRMPTFDNAAKPGQTFKKLCGLRRQALDLAYTQPDTRGMIDDVLAGKTLDTKSMSCDAIRGIFNAAAAMKKTSNNSGGARKSVDTGIPPAKGIKTLADLNQANKKHWANS